MKHPKIFFTGLVFLLVAACSEDNSPSRNDPPEDIYSKMAQVANLQGGAAVKYQEAFLATGNSLDALIEMANWCVQQPEVQKVYLVDESMIKIHFANGLVAPISVIPVDANGVHLLRGGGKGRLTQFSYKASDEDDYVIENEKAMVFLPFENEFYPEGYDLLHKFSDGKQKLQPTLLLGKDADLAAISTFKDYGFIILDTHGQTNGFTILTKIPEFDDVVAPGRTPFTDEQLRMMMAYANNLPLDKVANGELQLGMEIHVKQGASVNSITCSYHVLVTDKYIKQIPKLDRAIVFGNHCYSGFTKVDPEDPDSGNLPEAWKAAGAISYYGYKFSDGRSTIVGNDFARQMEDSLITNLLYDLDSTGIAHLENDFLPQVETNKAFRSGGLKVPVPGFGYSMIVYTNEFPQIIADFFFHHYDNVHYRYETCGEAFIDDRDGQEYPTVCIGDKVWMAKNLNYAGAGVCYDNDGTNCTKFGRLYSIAELTNLETSDANPSGVRGLCPEGWHVPSTAEWKELFEAAGRSAGKLANPADWPSPNSSTNELGLSLMPGGRYTVVNDTTSGFSELGKTGHYWSSSRTGDGQFYRSALLLRSSGTNSMNYNDAAEIQYKDFVNYNTHYLSCRCVKD